MIFNVEEFEDRLVFINEGAFIPETIEQALKSIGEASKQELMEVLEKALPEVLNDEQKSKKVSNLLQAMKKEQSGDMSR